MESRSRAGRSSVSTKWVTGSSQPAPFTAISNTVTTPIVGTFANLPDGSTFTVGRNTYQADYQGGDGNDLTLTGLP